MLPSRGIGWPGGWSQDRFEQVQHFRNWNYVSIHTICSKIGQLVPNLAYVHHQGKPGLTHKYAEIRDWGGTNFASVGGTVTPTVGFHRRKSQGGIVKPHEELEPLEYDHPLRRLLENPNQLDTSYDLFYELQMFVELCGVSYLWMVPNGWGVPCELWVIPAHWVWPRTARGLGYWTPQDQENATGLIDFYEVRPWGGTGTAGILTFPAREVLMFFNKNPLNKLDGWSPQAAGAMWIDTEESIIRSRWSQMINQARSDVHIQMPDDVESPDDDKIARIEAKFMAKYQGELNYGKPIFTPSGTKVTPLSFSPQEMAYEHSEEQARDMILALRQQPKSSVGIGEGMTFGSLLAAAAQFCSNAINPRLVPLGLRVTKDLAPRFANEDRPIRCWYDDCLDQETECLTAEGWKRHEELTANTRIACFDDETNTLVYRQPKRVIRYHHEGVLHVWKGGRIDAAMTPRHRVYVQKRKKSGRMQTPWEFKLAGEVGSNHQDYKVMRAAPAACDVPNAVAIDDYASFQQRELTGADWMEPSLWLEFLGYYISEGSLQRNKGENKGSWLVTISQAEDNRSFSKIERCVNGIDIAVWKKHRKWDRKRNTDKHIQFVCTNRGLYEHLLAHCGKGSRNKKIPDYVKAWPAADLRVLLDALIAGDGTEPTVNANTGVWCSGYTTISKRLADDVMEIAIKCGLAASVRQRKHGNPNHSVAYSVNLSTRTDVLVGPSNRSTMHYSGVVWCVEVPTGKFVVRRNGKAHITGNCSPADPQQVNADIAADQAACAITPNEVRALRGKAPYKHGGDDPLVQGPGGMMPFPLNTGEDLSPLADLVPVIPRETVRGDEGQVEDPNAPGGVDGEEGPKPKLSAPRIEEPNGPPQKSIKQMVARAVAKALEHKLSSTQFDLLPLAGTGELQDSISNHDVDPEEGRAGGSSNDHYHVTARYGIHTENPKEVAEVVRGFGPVTATLGETTFFPGKEPGDPDVVVVEVHSDDLMRMNALLRSSLLGTDSYPDYKPHLTLAYVHAGLGEKYVGLDAMDGVRVTWDKLIFSPPSGDKVAIKLTTAKGKRLQLTAAERIEVWGAEKQQREEKKETFHEEDHPRAQDGKFGSGGGSSSVSSSESAQGKKPKAVRAEMHEVRREGKGKDAKLVMGDGSPVPKHITPAMVPPAWKDVKVSKDSKADVQVQGFMDKPDPKNPGKTKRTPMTVYSDQWSMLAAANKFARVHDGLAESSKMAGDIQAARNDPAKKDSADCAWLMMEQGTRPGSEADNKGVGHLFGQKLDKGNVSIGDKDKNGVPKVSLKLGGKEVPVKDKKARQEIARRVDAGEDLHDSTYWLKSHGATTLEGRHVVEKPDGVHLQFIGKESVWHDHKVRDPKLAKMLVDRKKTSGETGKLFSGTNDGKVGSFVNDLDGGKFTPKDLRTMRGTQTAIDDINRRSPPKTEDEYKKAVMEVATKTSQLLGNEAKQALESYISPAVFAGWRAGLAG